MKTVLLALIRFYQRRLSLFFPSRCRFYPSCSVYAYTAVQRKGVFCGLFYAGRRLLRCHPFSEGGIDEPPSTHCTEG